MDFQHDKSWESLTAILNNKMRAVDAWTEFILVHEKNIPKPYWSQLKQLDIQAKQVHIVDWISNIVTKEPLPASIVAIWIGLFKSPDSNENEIPTIYFGGADNYEKDDSDWACDLKYLPKNRYAQPELLQEIDRIAKTDQECYEFLDWILPLSYCAFTFDEIARTKLDKNLFLKHRSKLFITVGHDSGDYIDLTPIEQ